MITFKIATFSDNTTGGKFGNMASQYQVVFDAISKDISSKIAGDAVINIALNLEDTNKSYGAAWGAPVTLVANDQPNKLWTLITNRVAAKVSGQGVDRSGEVDGSIGVSADFADYISKYSSQTSSEQYKIIQASLEHEIVHVLGFSGYFDYSASGYTIPYRTTYDANVVVKSVTDVQFVGQVSEFVNGGPVPLRPISGQLVGPYHVSSSQDLMNGGSVVALGLSDLDVAMLVDLGYKNQQTLTSKDGHTFVAGAQTTSINGTAGLDTVMYLDPASRYQVVRNGDAVLVTDKIGAGGTDTLTAMERILFKDGGVALDIGQGQVGGEAYRIYQAAFDRRPDAGGLGFWIKQLDNGASLKDVAKGFISSEEFTAKYGANLSDSAYVLQLYANVLHRGPDQGGFDFWMTQLHNSASRAELLAAFSESPENQAQVIGQISNGFSFIPYPG